MATSRPSNYAAISPLYLRIEETVDDARIVVNDGKPKLSAHVKLSLNCHFENGGLARNGLGFDRECIDE
jgi:hypothetical protein